MFIIYSLTNQMERLKYGGESLPPTHPPLDTLAWCDTATLVDDLFIVFLLSDREIPLKHDMSLLEHHLFSSPTPSLSKHPLPGKPAPFKELADDNATDKAQLTLQQ